MSREKAVEAGAAALDAADDALHREYPLAKTYATKLRLRSAAVIDAAVPYLLDRDQVARAIDPESWRYFDTGTFPPDHPASVTVVRRSREAADRVLALLATPQLTDVNPRP